MTRKKNNKKRKLFFSVLLIFLAVGLFYFVFNFIDLNNKIFEQKTMYLAASNLSVSLYDENLIEIKSSVRGTEVILTNTTLKKEENKYVMVKINDADLFVLEDNLVDKITDVVKEEKVYVRTPTTLYLNIDSGYIDGLLEKGSELLVVGYDELLENGHVNAYKVKLEGDKEGYVYQKYVVFDLDEALYNYEPEKYYNIHNSRSDIHSGVGGTGGGLDYFPSEKPNFENNVMPEKVYSLYLNSSRNIINNIDKYIEFAKETKINAFVVDIKDNESPAYKSKVYEKYSKTNQRYANNSFEDYKKAIDKLKSAGFYLIGRITVFKDKYFVQDNPDIAIMDKRTNKPFDNGTYWPSAFQRKVWQFNVELAKEAVQEFGFNEIQFDYVRFPDRIVSLDRAGHLDFRNEYEEEKVQAIQRFLMYARDELHKMETYISVDVFGESVNTYVTAYGQYWPAISNVVDVISGMPYPDHFAPYSYGIPKPWEEPYKVLYNWGKAAVRRQEEIPTPAIVRTWILAQNTMQGFRYDPKHIEAQIEGLVDAGLTGGYMTWASRASLDGYKLRKEAYSREY